MSSLTLQLWWGSAGLFAAAFIAAVLAQRFDRRQIGAENVWAKPAKFAISLALHFATLAWAAGLLGPLWQANMALTAMAVAATVCGVLELAYIAFQASRQLPSHFYVGTPLYAALYAAMGVGAVVLVLAAGMVGVIAWGDSTIALAEPLRSGVGLGLVGGSVLTLITAFRLGGNMSHSIGAEAPGAARMPLTGWSLTVGDLRPAHFLATHMMQALPVAGLVAALLLPPMMGVGLVWVCAALWTGATLVTFRLALSGRPLALAVR